jgi:exodeoxyribonuclease VII small subunit
MPTPEEITSMSFEKLLEHIESTVKKLEGGDLGLENSLLAYEQGVQLVRAAQKRLESMEAKVEELTADGQRKTLNVNEAGRNNDNGNP